MLESKYLTQDGIKLMLKHIYDKGFKYLFYNPDSSSFIASQQKPVFENDEFEYCIGFKKDFVDGFSTNVLEDLLRGHDYIDIAEELNIVDWNNIPVDTPILVSDYKNGDYVRRHFAKYEDGSIYAWAHGYTSWSAPCEENITEWNYAKLTE